MTMDSTLKNLDLLSECSEQELQSIPENILQKVNIRWASKSREVDDLVSEIEKCKCNADQIKFSLEKELVALRNLLEEEGKLKAEAQHHNEQNQSKLLSLEADLAQANERINELLTQFEMCRTEQENASQSLPPTGSLETKDRLIKELKQQVQNVEKQYAVSQTEKFKAVIQMEEANTFKIQFEYKERRLEQEKTLLTSQLKLVMKQLDERAEEALRLRGQHSTKMVSLQTELAQASEEVLVMKEEKEAADRIIAQKSSTIDKLLVSLNESRQAEGQLESTFHKELSAQEKLANIYKETSEDQRKRCEELEQEMKEVRALLLKATDQYGILEKETQSKGETYHTELQEMKSVIQGLQTDLGSAEGVDTADDRNSVSRSASAASKLMQKGLGLSELYSDYMSTKDKLLQSQDDNRRLNRYVDQILKEIEGKAPVLSKQRDDYMSALKTVEALRQQIDHSIIQMEVQQQDTDAAERRSGVLARENGSLSKQVKDLSKQVTVLLTEVQAARLGDQPAPAAALEERSGIICADDVISERLVTFTNVSEMQQQNIKLLASIRQLTDQVETVEKNAVETKTTELQEQLAKCRKDIEDMETTKKRMQNLLDSVTKQRDLYKALSHEQNTKDHPVDGNSPTPVSKRVVELNEKLETTQKEMQKVKQDYEEYRQERTINEKMDENQADKYRKQLEKTRADNIRLQTQSEYKDERVKTLTGNCESFQRQIKAIESKATTMQGIIGRHEGTIETLRGQNLKLSKELSRCEVQSFNIKEERAMLKESEARLVAEIESLHQARVSQNLILTNLEMIKNNLERSDVESRIVLENQVSKLNTEAATLRMKIESNLELKEAQVKLAISEEALKTVRLDLEAMKKLTAETEKELSETKTKLEEAQTSPPISSGSSTPDQMLLNLETKWKAEQVKCHALQTQLDAQRAAHAEVKAMCCVQEKQIAQATQASKIAEETLSRLRKDKTELEKQKQTLTAELIKLQESLRGCKGATSEQLVKITADLEQKTQLLEETAKQLKDLQDLEGSAVNRMKEQEKLADLAQQKYEQEVMLHGADLQSLALLKQKLANHDKALDHETRLREKSEATLADIQSTSTAKQQDMQAQKQLIQNRIEELEEQNQTLLEQFTQLSDKMAHIQTKLAAGADEANVSISEEETRTTHQLREVIKYLRTEKELALQKVLVSTAEAERVDAQKRSLESQLTLLSTQLCDEKEKNTSSLENMGRYGELMRKVHTLDALADSNRLLREEKQELVAAVEEFKTKAMSLESQLAPIQARLRELSKRIETVKMEKDIVQDEKDNYKKRTEELVEKLNKNNPEDFAKLQLQLTIAETQLKTKESELARSKTVNVHMQKGQQQLGAAKNQLQIQLNSIKEELKKSSDETKKISLEKAKLQQQLSQSIEKIKSVTLQSSSSQSAQNAEIQKLQEQATEIQKREESQRKEMEAQKRDKVVTDQKLREATEKCEYKDKQVLQLRRIAKKYKDIAEGNSGNTEQSSEVEMGVSAERMKELEVKIASLEKELQTKQSQQNVESAAGSSTQAEPASDSQSAEISEMSSTQKSEYESRISSLEQVKLELSKKISLQNKLLESIQKQSLLVSKSSSSSSVEKANDPPPTANIKPMAVPVPPVSAARVPPQTTSQSAPGSSKSIPMASIRPMTPSAGQSSTTVGVVTPLETHGNEGSVSSTAALPLATVTPAAQHLTATVSPTPVPVTESQSISQPSTSSATVEVITPESDPSPSGSRKRKPDNTDEAADAKRSRLEQDDAQPSSSTRTKHEHVAADDDDEDDDDDEKAEPMQEDIEREAQQGPEPSNQVAEVEGSNNVSEMRASFSLFGGSSSAHVQEQPSSTRPSFVPFSQGPSFNEGTDDRMVPSTPTLILQRPFEGISSLQVTPEDIFSAGISQSSQEAGSSHGGLSQEINSGNIDATRMDLGQVDVSSQRALPSIVVESSPIVEVSSDDNITSSGAEVFKEDSNHSTGGPSCSFSDVNQEAEPDSAVLQPAIEMGDEDSQDSKQGDSQQVPQECVGSPENSNNELSEHPQEVRSSSTPNSPQAAPARRITPIIWGQTSQTSPTRGRGRAAVTRAATRANARGQRARRSRPGNARGATR